MGEVEQGPLREEVSEIRDAAATGMAELRRAVSMLHDEFELATAIPDYVDAYAQRHHLAASCSVEGSEPRIAPERQLALFRILQEALSNVGRHANATRLTVQLRFGRAGIELSVADDGAGFVVDEVGGGHYGLRSMRERAERVGGSVDVTSAPGEGTRVAIAVPVDVAEDGVSRQG